MVEVLVNNTPSVATSDEFVTREEAELYAKGLCEKWQAAEAYRVFEYGFGAQRRTISFPPWVKAERRSDNEQKRLREAWYLPKITDYWDWSADSVEKYSLEIMVAAPEIQPLILDAIRVAITEHVKVLPEGTLLDVLWIAADDLYRSGNRAKVSGSIFEQYIEASAGTLFALAAQRKCILHYLVDNRFEQTSAGMERPLGVYSSWFRAAGLVYICPQLIARDSMSHDGRDSGSYFEILPQYIDEAKLLANRVLGKCHAGLRHYIFLNADDSPEPFNFADSLGLAGFPGIITVVRTEAPVAGSHCAVFYPK